MNEKSAFIKCLSSCDFSDFNKIVILEKNINYKKNNNIPLTDFEKMFDLFIFPPSILLKFIEKKQK